MSPVYCDLNVYATWELKLHFKVHKQFNFFLALGCSQLQGANEEKPVLLENTENTQKSELYFV